MLKSWKYYSRFYDTVSASRASTGTLVKSVAPGSFAERNGIHQSHQFDTNDQLIAINGRVVQSYKIVLDLAWGYISEAPWP